MMRIVIIALLAALVYYGGGWLMANPGQVEIDWLGVEISIHIAMLAAVLLATMVVAGYFSVLLWRFATWPTRRRTRKAHRTTKKGLEQLTRGVTALAMGDEKIAEESLKKARALLPGEPLPMLLTAQLRQRQGNHAEAQNHFRELVFHPTTTGLATRKLIEQHLQRQEWDEALKLTEEAHKTTPRDNWLTVTRINLAAHVGDTAQMLALTEGWQWQSPLSREERYRYAALAHYLSAQKEEMHPSKRERELRHALGYAPDFLPATIAYAENSIAEENPKAARKTLLSAWRAAPSPALIQPIIDSLVEEPPEVQARLLKPFLKEEDGSLHHMLAARHALKMGDALRARTALEKSLAQDGTREAMLLMADIETALKDVHAAAHWKAKAANAPEGESWVCQECGRVHVEWQPHCAGCGQFDSLAYERPEAHVTSVDVATI